MREAGVYKVEIPGLTARLRRTAVFRVRPANGTPGMSARKVGPSANFMVFTRDEQSGAFAEYGFEFAVFLPEHELEGTAGGRKPASRSSTHEVSLPYKDASTRSSRCRRRSLGT